MFGYKHLVSIASVILALSHTCLALAVSKDVDGLEENGARIARGLLPLKPKRMYDPTRPARPRAVPSGTPHPCNAGRIRIDEFNAAGDKIGELGWLSEGNDIIADPASATVYRFAGYNTGSSNLAKLNQWTEGLIALKSSGEAGLMHLGSYEYATPFFSFSHYPARTVYVDPVTGKKDMREHTVWDIKQSNNLVNPTWINGEGAGAFYFAELTPFAYGNKIYFSGDAPLTKANLDKYPEFPDPAQFHFAALIMQEIPGSVCFY